jgi:hypothetical protein
MRPNTGAAAAPAVHICCEIDVLRDHAASLFRIFTKHLSTFRYIVLIMSVLRVTPKNMDRNDYIVSKVSCMQTTQYASVIQSSVL